MSQKAWVSGREEWDKDKGKVNMRCIIKITVNQGYMLWDLKEAKRMLPRMFFCRTRCWCYWLRIIRKYQLSHSHRLHFPSGRVDSSCLKRSWDRKWKETIWWVTVSVSLSSHGTITVIQAPTEEAGIRGGQRRCEASKASATQSCSKSVWILCSSVNMEFSPLFTLNFFPCLSPPSLSNLLYVSEIG